MKCIPTFSHFPISDVERRLIFGAETFGESHESTETSESPEAVEAVTLDENDVDGSAREQVDRELERNEEDVASRSRRIDEADVADREADEEDPESMSGKVERNERPSTKQEMMEFTKEVLGVEATNAEFNRLFGPRVEMTQSEVRTGGEVLSSVVTTIRGIEGTPFYDYMTEILNKKGAAGGDNSVGVTSSLQDRLLSIARGKMPTKEETDELLREQLALARGESNFEENRFSKRRENEEESFGFEKVSQDLR